MWIDIMPTDKQFVVLIAPCPASVKTLAETNHTLVWVAS